MGASHSPRRDRSRCNGGYTVNFDTPFFLSIFLPISLLLFLCIRNTAGRKWLMIVLSLVFCAFGSLSGAEILLLSSAVNYCCGLLLRKTGPKRLILTIGIGLDLLLLGLFKYTGALTGSIAAPLGISFFTFREISYLVDIFRCSRKDDRFSDFLLYVSFFPQLISGPIARYADFHSQIRTPDAQSMAAGLRRFVWGLGKRLFLAVPLAGITGSIFALEDGLSLALAWMGAVSCCLYIYLDFASYSDMAIGLGNLFGYGCPENFRNPYCAVSITDFWRRWHISLSSWLRDYVYFPLGGSRKGIHRAAVNKLAVFLLCGLWHGAGLNYLLWGAWHGLFAALETLNVLPKKPKYAAAARFYTLLVVGLGFVLFQSADLPSAGKVLWAMAAGGIGSTKAAVLLHRLADVRNLLVLGVGVLLCTPAEDLWKKRVTDCRILNAGAVVLLLACLIALSSGSFLPFLYAQF